MRRALVFPLHEADRHPAYRVPNDRVLDWAAPATAGSCRWLASTSTRIRSREARRAMARGARGIKLHPRAQAFTVDDARLEPVFALAEEERLPVLIHAGRGMPPIGAHLAAVAARHPGAILILAHAAIVDQERIADLIAGRANVFFDTSTWSVFDILALLGARGAGAGAVRDRHPVRQPPLGADADRRGAGAGRRHARPCAAAVMGETLEGILRGELPDALGAASGRGHRAAAGQPAPRGLPLGAMPMLWLRQRDVIGMIGLAAGVCGPGSGAGAAARAARGGPRAVGRHAAGRQRRLGGRRRAAARGDAADAARARPGRHAPRPGAAAACA